MSTIRLCYCAVVSRLQFILPQHALSRLLYHLSRCRLACLKHMLIKGFIWCFAIELGQAKAQTITAYPHFNAFFTRALKPGARVIEQAGIVSPVDGVLSQIGRLSGTMLVQAKDRYYSLEALLAGDQSLVRHFIAGRFATFYLAPRDYHRVHMPIGARLRQMIYVPGRLFSVNACSSRMVDNLFARNERLICLFESPIGPVAVIMVGAIFVGSMETIWQGEISPGRAIHSWSYPQADRAIQLKKGEEMGRFNMGSTVILLCGEQLADWSAGRTAGQRILLGQGLVDR